MTDLIDFREALKRADKAGGRRHVLLGNGFSIGAHDRFRYGSLFEQAKESDLPDRVTALFDRYGTTNFETVLRQLDEGRWLAEHYGLGPDESEPGMKEDYAMLKRALVDAIGAVHPSTRTKISDDLLFPAVMFLKKFSSVFTTCYDLLLYWVMLRSQEGGSPPFQDGFGWRAGDPARSLVFLGQTYFNKKFVHYLHGALHLTTQGGEVHKLRFGDSDDRVPIVVQVREALEEKQYPLVVSEGNYVNKMERIESSSYLSWVFRRFEEIDGHLFTYGTALSDEDEHIQDAIVRNTKLTSLLIGVYGDVNSDENRRLVATSSVLPRRRVELNTRLPKKKQGTLDVSFYNSATAPVWDT